MLRIWCNKLFSLSANAWINVDHLLASGRISSQMTVSVLLSVAENATNDNVRLDALRTMPQLLEQKNYQQELKPLLVRSISSLIPSLTGVEILRRQLMLDIQTLVEADESYRKLLITELSGLDRSWSFINNKPGGNSDQKQIRVGLQIKLALLSLVQELTVLAEKVTRFTGKKPKLVDVSADHDRGTYEIGFLSGEQSSMPLASSSHALWRGHGHIAENATR